MNKIHDLFITIIITQIVVFGICSLFNVGVNTNITYDFPALDEGLTLVNIIITVWNVVKFLFINIYFSFISYDLFILQLVNLIFNLIVWFCTFQIGLDSYYKVKL